MTVSIGVGLLIAACDGRVAATHQPSPTPSSTASPAASPTPSAVTPPASSAPAASTCAGADLSISVISEPGASTHISDVLLIENTGSSTCVLTGYPGLDAVEADGTTVHAERTLAGYLGGVRTGTAPPVVSLAPRQEASAMVEGLDNPPSTDVPCPQFTTFVVTPPNTSSPSRLAPAGGSFAYCQNSLQIHPVVEGTAGYQD